ncbi:hypothetical protein HII13_004091 [Brettanomyces bruxellensis]|nr:hypothetical protein HII13_004091 [Brettanomyces bruxellensis]
MTAQEDNMKPKAMQISSILTGNRQGEQSVEASIGTVGDFVANFRNKMKAAVAMDRLKEGEANRLKLMKAEFELLATTGGLYIRPETVNELRARLGQLDPKIFEKISRRSRNVRQEEEAYRRVKNARLRRLVELQRQREGQLAELQRALGRRTGRGPGGFVLRLKRPMAGDDGEGPAGPGGRSKRRRRGTRQLPGETLPDDVLMSTGELPGAGHMTTKEQRALTRQYDNTYVGIWKDMSRKDGPKAYRQFQQSAQAKLLNMRKTAQLAARESKRWKAKTTKSVKDQTTKARRSMREMLNFWKKNEREEKMQRVKAEQEAIANAKKEEEQREAKRQARKLNFLINQTELYSHFIGKKLKTEEYEREGNEKETEDKNENKDEDKDKIMDKTMDMNNAHPSHSIPPDFDLQNDQQLQQAAAANAQSAVQAAKRRAQQFNGAEMNFQDPTSSLGGISIPQPKMLDCTLKEYQKKGLNWLASLYEQGINGILADEMGLGKTVQSISVLAYLAETYNVWGPFLVVTPASTLHNWQQEITKFVPEFKVLPYWGTAKDRRILRKFWDRKSIVYHRESAFHVVVTSYQLAVADSQYFQKMKWQYMILDEAQAIKSSQSSRWKSLLSFQCRNRLLLTGTPIQNNMQELWALLHFIMPSLFDSHDEFSEWFSKDIESHAGDHTQLNQLQLHRLHAILKPFMLRRVKKNVQSELGDKIEVDVFCELTSRQKKLYRMLRSQINLIDLIESNRSIHSDRNRRRGHSRRRTASPSPSGASSGGLSGPSASTGFNYDDEESGDSLMNVVMQFRKVCNHPDLFERADSKSAFVCGRFAESGPLIREANAESGSGGADGSTNYLELDYTTRNEISMHIPRLVFDELLGPGPESRVFDAKTSIPAQFSIWAPENIRDSPGMQALVLSGLSVGEIAASVHRNLLQEAISRRSYVVQEPAKPPILSVQDLCTKQMYVADMQPCAFDACRAPPVALECSSRRFVQWQADRLQDRGIRQALSPLSLDTQWQLYRAGVPVENWPKAEMLPCLLSRHASHSTIRLPSMERFVMDSGKLKKLDQMLPVLKKNGHKCLVYFQMTRMMDLMEEYLTYRQYKYIRLDGSSRLSDRRDLVDDWQTNPDLFIFLLSTRAGGLGINLTAADTVIFYDSDWNPTIDSQAMDRAHRLGQTRQVTVYRLLVKGTIEERMRDRAKQKEQVQKVVMGGKMDGEADSRPENPSGSDTGLSTRSGSEANIDASSFTGSSKGKAKNKKEMAMWLFKEDDD